MTLRRLIAVIALAIPAICAAEEIRIQDLSGGMHSNPSSNKIPDNASPHIQNFLTDIEGMAVERNGFIKKETVAIGNGQSVPNMWRFNDTNGDEWLIAFSSRTFYRSKRGTAFEQFGLIASNTNVPDCAVNLGKLMCVNGIDSAWTFDGTSTAVVSGAPIGRFIEPWRNRFAIADITSARSAIRFSEDGLATNWVIGSTATAPFQLTIAGTNDGKPIRCLRGSYQDNMVVMRQNDIFSVSGFDQGDVNVRKVTDEVGCVDDRTIQELDGGLHWLSNRGVEKRLGNSIQNISEPIRNITDAIVSGALSGEKSNDQTTAADWDAGTKTSTDSFDTATVSGDLTAKRFTNTSTSLADFSTGTFSGNNPSHGFKDFNTGPYANSITTIFPDEFDTLKTGCAGCGTANLWDEFYQSGSVGIAVSGGNLVITGDSPSFGGLRSVEPIGTLLYGTTFAFSVSQLETGIGFSFILNTSSTVADPATGTYWRFGTGFAEPTDYAVSWSNTSGSSMSERRVGSPPTWTIYITTSSYIISAGTQTTSGSHSWSNSSVYLYLRAGGGSISSAKQAKVDYFRVAPISFNWTSGVFDMDYGTGDFNWGKFSDTSSSSGTAISTITYKVFASQDGSAYVPTAGYSVTSGTVIGNVTYRYLKTQASFLLDDINQGAPLVLYDMSAPAYSSGTFQSQTMDLGGIPSAWRQVQISETDMDGKISYQFNASTSSNYFNPSSWTTLSHGDIPTNAVNQYVAFKASFTITHATNVATLHSFTTNWIDGSSNPLSSTVWDRRYILSYSTTNAFPEKALVWQRNESWTLFDGIPAASYATWNNEVYFGNSSANGYVYQFDTGSNDDGSDIDSSILFKSYDFGSPARPKEFSRAFATYLGNTSHSGSFDLSYILDRDDNDYALGSGALNESTGQTLVKFPFPLNQSVRGREVQFRISKSGTGNRLRLYDLVVEYEVKEPD